MTSQVLSLTSDDQLLPVMLYLRLLLSGPCQNPYSGCSHWNQFQHPEGATIEVGPFGGATADGGVSKDVSSSYDECDDGIDLGTFLDKGKGLVDLNTSFDKGKGLVV
ncbi:hypothetical protein GOBAR_AA26067 [Gossypium barbadense]|uniref:Uncharacterized protein n=1 Tax=Gossypium barbadense TaxID=3634 RepID=A0A2P5WU60_GOSBA|nr:hypothetical protein GOBAR_AA26067 [Gossypium barbadense]